MQNTKARRLEKGNESFNNAKLITRQQKLKRIQHNRETQTELINNSGWHKEHRKEQTQTLGTGADKHWTEEQPN